MKKRITINVDGSPRTVLSILENPNSLDLNIHITGGGATYTADSLRDLVVGTKEEDYVRSEKHITVHNSPQSLNNNVIKRTVTYFDQRLDTSVQVTGAIKADNLYTPAIFRVCGDLSRDRYALPEGCGDEFISLGAYDPSGDQLRFMVVVSGLDKPFEADIEHPSNHIAINFQSFTITLIWSYLNQPSHPQAIDFFLCTTREGGPIAGFEWWQIYNLYTDLHMANASEYFEVYGKND